MPALSKEQEVDLAARGVETLAVELRKQGCDPAAISAVMLRFATQLAATNGASVDILTHLVTDAFHEALAPGGLADKARQLRTRPH